MSRLKKRTVIVKLQANSPEDPRRLLEAVEAAFHPSNVEVQVGATGEEDITQPESIGRRANEQMEEETRRRVGAHLESKATRISTENERQGKPANARRPAPPEDVVAKRLTLRDKVRILRRVGWRVTVKVAWEVAKELAFDAARSV